MENKNEEKYVEDPMKFLTIGFGFAYLAQFAYDLMEYFTAPSVYAPFSGAPLFFIFTITGLIPAIGLFVVSFEKKHLLFISLIFALYMFGVAFYMLTVFGIPAEIASAVNMSSANSASSFFSELNAVAPTVISETGVAFFAFTGAVVALRADFIEKQKRS